MCVFALYRHPLSPRALSSAAMGKQLYTDKTEIVHVTASNAACRCVSFSNASICRAWDIVRFRLSREPTIDDAYRLRKIAAVVAEIRSLGSAATTTGQQLGNANAVKGERRRLPVGQNTREDLLFQLLSQLESVESLAQAAASLGGGGGRLVPPACPKIGSRPDGAIKLSASFQRRACDLCRERAEQAAGVTAAVAAAEKTSTDKSKNSSIALPTENEAAIAVLRFRAAAFELYTVLESVELNPAAEGEDGDPAFLPPGKRGWKHGVLCEEAAGWADMVRGVGGARGAPLPSAELPEFQVGEESAWYSTVYIRR